MSEDSELYFLDTSFIINALLHKKRKASDFFDNFFNDQPTICINIVVLSELINALEGIYFGKYCKDNNINPNSSRERNSIKKEWRKSNDENYHTAISEYEDILSILGCLDSYRVLAIPNGEVDIKKILETKKNNPYFDANDCIHLFHLDTVDHLVTADSDFLNLKDQKKIKYIPN